MSGERDWGNAHNAQNAESESAEAPAPSLSRRQTLQFLGVGLAAGFSTACQKALQVPTAERVIDSATAMSPAQRALAMDLVDLIIPTTDTPGAIEAGVGELIEYIYANWLNTKERALFSAGLLEIENLEPQFVALDQDRKIELLNELEARQAMYEERGFLSLMKELVVNGYYNSEVGATQERRYLPMPGRYDGYYKFEDAGKQWAS